MKEVSKKKVVPSLLILNGDVVDIGIDLGDFYRGASVFTTFRTKNGKAIWWDQHLARLRSHAKHFAFIVPRDEEFLAAFAVLIEASSVDIKVRFTLTSSNFFASAEAYHPPMLDVYEGVQVCWGEYYVHPQLAAYKTGNYLPYLLAHQQAQENNYFEALMCTEAGILVDACRSSPILYECGKLTIPIGGLHSIAREMVIQSARDMGLGICFKTLTRAEITGQILLASSTIGLVPVGPPSDREVENLIARFCPYS